MNLHELITDCVLRSTRQVFSTMLDAELESGPPWTETGTPEANDGVVSLIGIAGSWAGMGSLACSPGLACRACAQMLMTETQAVNEEVLDAVAELTNMIIGGVKNDLESELGPLGLSIPTVVYGRNFKTKGAGHTEWIVIPFTWGEDRLLVKMCISPKEAARPHQVPLGQSCPVEV
jgi:chemotaxis protein CheX